jgi:hypothetical protein
MCSFLSRFFIRGGKEQFVVFIWTVVSITEQSNLLNFTQHQGLVLILFLIMYAISSWVPREFNFILSEDVRML